MSKFHAYLRALLMSASLLLVGGVAADDIRPLLVQIDAGPDGITVIRLAGPARQSGIELPHLALPDFCTSGVEDAPDQSLRQYICRKPIGGSGLSFIYPPGSSRLPVVVKIQDVDGSTRIITSPANETFVEIPIEDGQQFASHEYIPIGVTHVLVGFDHLLFLLCLIWIAGSLKRTLWIVTGFTVAHSITLGLAAFNVVEVDINWVEVTIAMSVLFLALEVIRNRRDTLTWRYPAIVAVLFGLLHGFGFASVLTDIGLPEHNALAALLLFNLGVEIGQVLFVLASSGLFWLITRQLKSHSILLARTQLAIGYGAGCIATLWIIERLQ